MNIRINLPAIALAATVTLWLATDLRAQTPDENPVNTEIEQLVVGNYWTTKETRYGADGDIDTEQFSTVVVVAKEVLAGRTCFRMKQITHDSPRFDLKEAEVENENDYVYWEYLDDGNLYYFEAASTDTDGAKDADKTPESVSPDDSEKRPTTFTADNPAIYLKYPAEAGDLYQSFDTVGTVHATDRLIKTPAGEFICHVYGFLTDTSEAPHSSYTLEHWCPGIGFVKLEEFEVKGDSKRILYSMELLAYHLEDGRSGGNTDDNGRRSKIENVH